MKKNQVFRHTRHTGAMLFYLGLAWVFFSVIIVQAAFEPSITLYGGAEETRERRISLSIIPPREASHMRLANSREELSDAEWTVVRDDWNAWWLTDESGWKTVYVQFRLRDGRQSDIYSDRIYLRLPGSVRPGIVINDDDRYTEQHEVILSIISTEDAVRMRVAGDDRLSDVDWRSVVTSLRWTLQEGSGERRVLVQFEDGSGNISNIFSDEITVVKPAEIFFSASVSGDNRETTSQNIIINLSYSQDIQRVRVSNNASFAGSDWQPVRRFIPWVITAGSGQKQVYIEFEDRNERTHKTELSLRYTEPVRTRSALPVMTSRVSTQGAFAPGSVVKGSGKTVYYVGEEETLYPFPSATVFFSWYNTFHHIREVSDGELARRGVGSVMCVRPGTHLVTFAGFDRVYAVLPACQLRPIMSEVEAFVIYGADWGKRVVTLSADERINYRIRPIGGEPVPPGDADTDLDGVLDSIEHVFGSDQTRTDTDGDGLSDYEELFYWFSDVLRRDTDADGIEDGEAILRGISPTTGQRIAGAPENTYTYPLGTLILIHPYDPLRRSYYYRSFDGLIYYVGKNAEDERFRRNVFGERFGVIAGLEVLFSKWVHSIRIDDPRLHEPLQIKHGTEYVLR